MHYRNSHLFSSWYYIVRVCFLFILCLFSTMSRPCPFTTSLCYPHAFYRLFPSCHLCHSNIFKHTCPSSRLGSYFPKWPNCSPAIMSSHSTMPCHVLWSLSSKPCNNPERSMPHTTRIITASTSQNVNCHDHLQHHLCAQTSHPSEPCLTSDAFENWVPRQLLPRALRASKVQFWGHPNTRLTVETSYSVEL